MITLLGLTSNLQTLKLCCISIHSQQSDPEYLNIQQSESFKFVSNTNIIKNLILNQMCSLEKVKLIVALCPRLEHLQTGMIRKKLNLIVQFLLLKSNHNTRKLFFLRITKVPKICLREVKRLIKLEKLLDDYFIEFLNRDLYLWW